MRVIFVSHTSILKHCLLIFSFTSILNCDGGSKSINSSVIRPTLTIYSSSTLTPVNSSIKISWSSKNSVMCEASGSWSGSKSLNGDEIIQISLAKTYNFILVCSGHTYSISEKIVVNGYQDWNFIQKGLDLDGGAANDFKGQSVSISGDGNVVGIWSRNNNGNGNNAGHVSIYKWNENTFLQQGFGIDGEGDGDSSGYSISLSSNGNLIAIGSPYNDSNGDNSGHARVYTWNGNAWIQQGNDIDGEAAGDYSGESISLSADGTVIAIGAYGNDGNGNNSGHARVFAWQ